LYYIDKQKKLFNQTKGDKNKMKKQSKSVLVVKGFCRVCRVCAVFAAGAAVSAMIEAGQVFPMGYSVAGAGALFALCTYVIKKEV
jgi:hypothetical protein